MTAEIGDSEALVAQRQRQYRRPERPWSAKVAVPFVSTTHYSLLAALKRTGGGRQQVNIVNLRPQVKSPPPGKRRHRSAA